MAVFCAPPSLPVTCAHLRRLLPPLSDSTVFAALGTLMLWFTWFGTLPRPLGTVRRLAVSFRLQHGLGARYQHRRGRRDVSRRPVALRSLSHPFAASLRAPMTSAVALQSVEGCDQHAARVGILGKRRRCCATASCLKVAYLASKTNLVLFAALQGLSVTLMMAWMGQVRATGVETEQRPRWMDGGFLRVFVSLEGHAARAAQR